MIVSFDAKPLILSTFSIVVSLKSDDVFLQPAVDPTWMLLSPAPASMLSTAPLAKLAIPIVSSLSLPIIVSFPSPPMMVS